MTCNILNIQNDAADFLPISLAPEDWLVALEQSLLVLIIVARWLMPKGDLTRNQLSSLLLIHLGTASDIVDFLTLLSEGEVKSSTTMVYAVLAVWSWSLLQFPFVVTVTKEEQAEDNIDQETSDSEEEKDLEARQPRVKCVQLYQAVLETEVWGICVSVFAQDGPFFIMRLTAIFSYHVVNYTNFFFAAKNGLVLLLQFYRLISLCLEHKSEKEKRRQDKENMKIKATRLWEMYKTKGMWKAN